MKQLLDEVFKDHRQAAYLFMHRLIDLDRRVLLRSDVLDTYREFVDSGAAGELPESFLADFVNSVQEVILTPPQIAFAVRARVGSWSYVLIHGDELFCDELTVSEFLKFREALVMDPAALAESLLEFDTRPFEREFPRLREERSIGRGVEFLNRHLSGRLFGRDSEGKQLLLEFLQVHQYRGHQLMLSRDVQTLDDLRTALNRAMDHLDGLPEDRTWRTESAKLRAWGFEPGWGRTAAQIRDTMRLLSDILEAPSPDALERLLRRLPMIFSIAVISPHGYFAQAGVLGKPDTGGQIVYILDQVRSLESEMRASIRNQGLDIAPQIIVLTRLIPDAGDTTVNQRIEPISGTENAFILRVPFRDEAGEVIPHWISRFRIWPYLERFAHEAEKELLAELGNRPDFIIGNYSDGNIVGTIMSKRLGITQCNIAHALEKTKYLYSDLYWREHENEHNFACQHTADLIAMNAADVIISSTFHEVAGTRDTVGQYETFQAFSLPGLYRVRGGIDVFDPKFNVVSPGADDRSFFSHRESGKRHPELQRLIKERIFGFDDAGTGRGAFADREKPMLFAMSRFDHVKNVTGFLQWYAECPELRERANVLLIGGSLNAEDSQDPDERFQIETLHRLMDEHDLDKCVRWAPMAMDKTLVGEVYRCVADTGGAFVQPALFEAFGLTVVEAMATGLPTFATLHGGPREIIEHGVSGFHIDPNHGDAAARLIADFLRRCAEDPSHWEKISRGALRRVADRYTWKRYATRLLALSRIYGFWKFITNIEREQCALYMDMFYNLMYRPLARKVAEKD